MPALSSDGCARVGCNVLLGGDLLGAKPDADEAQGLRRAQRASNPNGARLGSHPITT
jgi:hypothetical protein